MAIATGGSQDWGPTSITGFYPETTPPASGYTIYYIRSIGGPSVHIANNDTQCIFFLKSFGSTGSTISDVLAWASGQSNYYVQSGSAVGVTPTPTPTVTSTSTNTPTPTPTPTPTITSTGTNTPTPTPTMTPTPSSAGSTQFYYGTTAALAYGMTSGLTSVTFSGGADLCSASNINSNTFNSLPANPIYIYDSSSGAIRQATPLGYYSSANLNLGACTYQYGRYRVATSQNGVCSSYTGFTDANFYSSDICTQSYFGSNQLTGLTAGTFYLYDTVTKYERIFTNSYSNNTLFYFSGACSTNNCSQYVYATTEVGACTSVSGLTNVSFAGGTLCSGNTMYATEFSGMTSGVYYIRDTTNNNVRMTYVYGAGMTSAYLSGTTCTTPCTVTRSGYYIDAVSDNAVTGGTQISSVDFYGSTMCSGYSFSGTVISTLATGTYYLYDATNNKLRPFTYYGGGSSTGSFMNGPCTTPSGGGGRSGYYYATTMPGAITGGTAVNTVTFSGGSGDLCSCSSAIDSSFSTMSGYIYIYNATTGDVRKFYGMNSSSITNMGPCLNTNTPTYYYATFSNDCYGTQTLTNVSFSGGSDMCSATGFSANELSSLGPNTYYMRNPFTDNFRSFYCAYNGSVSFTAPCTQYSC